VKKEEKIKVALVSNYSRAKTGFGCAMRNILTRIYQDSRFEVIECANGLPFGNDAKTPWKCYGTYPSDPRTLQEIHQDQHKERLAAYGNYTIDEIIKLEKPDTVIGMEDIWAFDWAKRIWFDKLNTVIWTTLDSLPILDQAYHLAPKVDKFLVWASFAESEMKKRGFDVETLHGPIDYSQFSPLDRFSQVGKRADLRKKHGLQDNFVIGFVFKNQLRKSVPNLLDGFKIFKKENPEAKLLLHTDWKLDGHCWDIPKYLREKEIDPKDVLATYICQRCKEYIISPYEGEEKNCPLCGSHKSLVTKSNLFGLTEEQLNEVYNIMDVYCHPFTSGGQELPIQEAKATGLITLVTEYSCGLDCCYEKDGGIPLKWSEYREPFTDFIKATTIPESIAESLQKVKDMTPEERREMGERSIECVKRDFNIDSIVNRLKEILLELGKTDWDFDFQEKIANTTFIPEMNTDDGVSPEDWLIDLYKRMFDKTFSEKDIEIKEGVKLLATEGRGSVYQYLLSIAREKNHKIQVQHRKLEDFFDGPDEKRIAVLCPESAGDVLMINSLVGNLKKLYPEYNIYFMTKPVFYPMVDDNDSIHKLIPYQDEMMNLLMLEGQSEHKGFFDIAFLPTVGSQRFLNYMHNGIDRDGLAVKRDLEINNYDPYLQTR